MTDRFNQPREGATDWHVPVNENFADLGVEVPDVVPTWDDLPDPSGATSSTGNPKLYRVEEPPLVVADTGQEWTVLGGTGGTEHPLPGVATESLSTGTIGEGVFLVGPGDADLDEKLAAAGDRGGLVFLQPGVHADHTYPVTVPNGVTLVGAGMGARSPQADSAATVLDAGGGEALRLGSDAGLVQGFAVRDLRVRGTVRTQPGEYVRDFTIERVAIRDADMDVGSGRGLAIRTAGPGRSAFRYHLDTVAVAFCDGYGISLDDTGQSWIANCRSYYCGHRTDGATMRIGGYGGGDECLVLNADLNAGGAADVDGLVLESPRYVTLVEPQVESVGGHGIVVGCDGGQATQFRLFGGKVFGCGKNGLLVGPDAHSGEVKGTYIAGTALFDNDQRGGGHADVRFGASTNQAYLGVVSGNASGIPYRLDGGVQNDGHRVRCHPELGQLMHADPSDVTAQRGTFHHERRFHDGSGAIPEGPVLWDGDRNRWFSVVDGSRYAPQ